jgi:hypothetical protein
LILCLNYGFFAATPRVDWVISVFNCHYSIHFISYELRVLVQYNRTTIIAYSCSLPVLYLYSTRCNHQPSTVLILDSRVPGDWRDAWRNLSYSTYTVSLSMNAMQRWYSSTVQIASYCSIVALLLAREGTVLVVVVLGVHEILCTYK